jgi:hypothetical protein
VNLCVGCTHHQYHLPTWLSIAKSGCTLTVRASRYWYGLVVHTCTHWITLALSLSLSLACFTSPCLDLHWSALIRIALHLLTSVEDLFVYVSFIRVFGLLLFAFANRFVHISESWYVNLSINLSISCLCRSTGLSIDRPQYLSACLLLLYLSIYSLIVLLSSISCSSLHSAIRYLHSSSFHFVVRSLSSIILHPYFATLSFFCSFRHSIIPSFHHWFSHSFLESCYHPLSYNDSLVFCVVLLFVCLFVCLFICM